jgi:long-subunit acyl-CoA synthetase (AMP-forming)
MTSEFLLALEKLAAAEPDKICVRDGTQSLSCKQLMQKVAVVATELEVYQNNVVGLLADNSLSWLLVDLAAQHAGIILLPLPLFFTPAQIQHALQSTGSIGVIHADHLSPTSIGPNFFAETTHLHSIEMIFTATHLPSDVLLPIGTAKITFTSGSTGTPKGVCLSNDNQFQVTQSLLAVLQMQNVRHLALLPLSTLLENIAGLYSALLSGGQVILLPVAETGVSGSLSGKANKLIKTLTHYQPESLILVPELLSILVLAVEQGWHPPSSLKFVAVGGSRVAKPLIERARQLGIPVYEGYGLSECSSVVSLNTPSQDKPGTAGRVLPHINISFSSAEIVVEGNAFLGYVGSEEPAADEVYTGDYGYLDADGYLVIQGRKKQLIISSYGRNINPEWVESEVLAHPEVLQCVLFGDARPFCVALIYSTLDDVALDHWIKQINQSLPQYAQLSKWLRLEQPLTSLNGLLTLNGRPRREAIFNHFQDSLESLYQEPQYGIF